MTDPRSGEADSGHHLAVRPAARRTTADGDVALAWELSSDWPLLAGATTGVECLIARTVASCPEARKRVAPATGRALALAVARCQAPPVLWLLMAQPTRIPLFSRSVLTRVRRQGFFESWDPEADSLVESIGRRTVVEFEVVDNDQESMTRALTFRVSEEDWGLAALIMLTFPAVGVAFERSQSPDQLVELGRRVFLGDGTRPATARATHLRRLLLAPETAHTGVLTVSGEFDDRFLEVEYHQFMADRDRPSLRP